MKTSILACSRKAGFTIVEILCGVLLLAVLIAVAAPAVAKTVFKPAAVLNGGSPVSIEKMAAEIPDRSRSALVGELLSTYDTNKDGTLTVNEQAGIPKGTQITLRENGVRVGK